MTIDPLQLLRKLEPSIRPAGVPQRPGDAAAPLEKRSFDELLTLVSSGRLGAGTPVTVARGASVEPALDEAQRARLGAATDTAAAAGARRAVMLLDGRGLVVDVAGREVTAELREGAAADVVTVDAAVYVLGGETQPSENIQTQSGRRAG